MLADTLTCNQYLSAAAGEHGYGLSTRDVQLCYTTKPTLMSTVLAWMSLPDRFPEIVGAQARVCPKTRKTQGSVTS